MRSWSTHRQPIRVEASSYFSLTFLGVFRVIYHVNFSYFCLRMNLDLFGRVWGTIGLILVEFQHWRPETKPIGRGIPAERSAHHMRARQSISRSIAPFCRTIARGRANTGKHSADRSPHRADRSPVQPVDRPPYPIDRAPARKLSSFLILRVLVFIFGIFECN